MSSSKSESNTPKYIIDKPSGEDLYEGQSQNKLSENIAQFIVENESSGKKVIGIEGEWGSGKSNVIEILRSKLKSDYYFFIYDAWGHQEDLTRRSILEGLLTRLIDDEILMGKKDVWEKELKSLLAKTVEKEQKNIPQLSNALIFSFVGILLYSITKNISDNYLKIHTGTNIFPNTWNYIIAFLISLIAFIPLIIWLVYAFFNSKKGEKSKYFKELFYVYKGKEIKSISEETITEREPTPITFTKYLTKLEKGASKKLVIVFDNMDRLPSEKVKQVWSSIHTFFSSDEYNLKTWAIVPFDNNHIVNIFTEEDKYSSHDDMLFHQSDSYIHKTFSIVFHISPPVLSDWKLFFNNKFKSAFGFYPPENQIIETIFNYHHIDDPKIKPRDIIFFINELVSLKKLWNEEIPFKYLALFALKRMNISQNPFKSIISKNYLGSLNNLFKYDEHLDTIISALTFNVAVNKADELLLTKPIENALHGNGDFSELSKHKSFFNVLDSVFYNANDDVANSINCLESLPPDLRESNKTINYWNSLSDSIQALDIFEEKLFDKIKILIKRTNSHTIKEKLLRHLFLKSISNNSKSDKYYYGKDYFSFIKEIEILLNEISLDVEIGSYLPVNKMDAREYLEFIPSCPEDFEKYNVNFDTKELNIYLENSFKDNNITQYLPQIELLNSIDFSELKENLKGLIPNLTPSLAGSEEKTRNLFQTGKALSKDGKFPFAFPGNIALPLLDVFPSHENVVDLILVIIKDNISNLNLDIVTNSNFTQLLANNDLLEKLLKSYKYYLNYGDLIKFNLEFPTVLIKHLIIEITKNGGPAYADDSDYLVTKYVEIKSKIFENDQPLCNKLIEIIDSLQNRKKISIVEGSLTFINSILNDNYKIKSNLIDEIVINLKIYLSELDSNKWLIALKSAETSQIITAFSIMSISDNLNDYKLSQSTFTAYSEIIKDISLGTMPVPTNIILWNVLLDKMSGNFINLFKDVRDRYLNYNHEIISLNEFIFFEKGLFEFGMLDESPSLSDEVLRRILIPLTDGSADFLNVLRRNSNKVKSVIEKSTNSIDDFRNVLLTKYTNMSEDETTKTFYEVLDHKYKSALERLNTA